MPQLGRLSSNSLSGILSSGAPLPPVPQYSTLTWSSPIAFPAGSINLVAGSGNSQTAYDSQNIYITSGSTTFVNKIVKIDRATNIATIVTLPSPTAPNQTNQLPFRVVCGNGLVVAVGLGTSGFTDVGVVWVSSDSGNTWTTTTFSPSLGSNGGSLTVRLMNLLFLDGQFYLIFRYVISPTAPVNYGYHFVTSSDGVNWSSPILSGPLGFATDNNGLVDGIATPSGITPGYIIGTGSNTGILYRVTSAGITQTTSGVLGQSSGQNMAWLPVTNRFLSYIGNISAYYANYVSSGFPSFVSWATPGPNRGRVYVAYNGVSTPVILWSRWTQTNGYDISFDGGSTFSNQPMPNAGAFFNLFLSTGNDKIYNIEFRSSGTANFYVGTLT